MVITILSQMAKWLRMSGFMMEFIRAGIILNQMDPMLKTAGKVTTI